MSETIFNSFFFLNSKLQGRGQCLQLGEQEGDGLVFVPGLSAKGPHGRHSASLF